MYVSPAEVKALLERQVMMIDIRDRDEWDREHIPAARCMPLANITPDCLSEEALSQTDTVVFHCQSGIRTEQSKEQLKASVHPASALIMQGGLNAWKAAGYKVIIDHRQPFPLMRQVQITAGTLILGGTLAGALLTPLIYIIPGFVGAGLIFAGVSGWCGMAKLLSVMPWNRRRG
jgi:rhodanese-related sulfurtransferase